MEAFHRRGGEDRVTEVLATVLSGAPSFANGLAARVGLPAADRFTLATQTRVRPDCIIDLEIRGSSAADELLWLLWCEHKLNAPFREGQLAKYHSAMREAAGLLPFKLLAVTLAEPSPEVLEQAERHEIELLRWSDLMALAQSAGTALSGRAWRTTACESRDQETGRRLLVEWLDFCDHGELMEPPVEPLTVHAVEMLAHAEQVLRTVGSLTERAFAATCSGLDAGPVKERDDYWFADPPAAGWLDECGCTLYAKYDSDDSWTVAPLGAPVFAVGIFCEGEDADELRRHAAFQEALGETYFDASEGSGRKAYFDVGRSIPMSSISSDETLDSQERSLQGFFDQSLHELIACGEQAGLPDSK